MMSSVILSLEGKLDVYWSTYVGTQYDIVL